MQIVCEFVDVCLKAIQGLHRKRLAITFFPPRNNVSVDLVFVTIVVVVVFMVILLSQLFLRPIQQFSV